MQSKVRDVVCCISLSTAAVQSYRKGLCQTEAVLRAKAERTVGDLWDAAGQVVTLCEPEECPNYFESCGYDPG